MAINHSKIGDDRMSSSFVKVTFSTPKRVQLDLTSCADTQQINLRQDREGYDGFEYTDEKLSTRRIQIFGDPSSIFYFLRYF